MGNLDQLEWRPIPECPEYEISEYGNVRRLIAAHRYPKGRIRKPGFDKFGYHRMQLIRPNGQVWSKSVHYLVATAFLGMPKDGEEAHHEDHNKNNNHYKNLRWVSHHENIEASWKHNNEERRKTVPRGKDTGRAILTEDDIPKIFELARQGHTQREIASKFNTSHVAIGHVLRGQTWGYLEIDRTLSRRNVAHAKLTPDDILMIRKLWSEGYTQRTIARNYNVSHVAVGQIIRGETWVDVGIESLPPKAA